MEENIFDSIRHTDENGNEYWLARELAAAVGYKDYRNFKGLIEKAQKLCVENNAKTEDHFVESTEMVEVGSGYACLLIAEQILSCSKRLDNCRRRSIRGIRQVSCDTRQDVFVGL